MLFKIEILYHGNPKKYTLAKRTLLNNLEQNNIDNDI